MIIAALRKAIAQLALGNLMEGWAAPETDLLREADLLPSASSARDRAANRYCLPPPRSSYEIAERALSHAAKFLGEDREALDRDISDAVVLGILMKGDHSRTSASGTHQETRYAGHQPESAHLKQ